MSSKYIHLHFGQSPKYATPFTLLKTKKSVN